MNTARDYTIGSVKKALQILKLFEPQRLEMSLSELSAISGIEKSSMLRFLYTLRSENFISFNEETKKYSLGIELSRLGSMKYNTLDIHKVARKHLQKLSNATGMICYLGVRQGNHLVMAEQVIPDSVPMWTQMVVKNGGIRELYSTGIGRLFLAQQSDKDVEKYLNMTRIKKITEDTVVDKESLLYLIRKARKDGYSKNIEENEPYICSLCVPVMSEDGIMAAGISLCGMKNIILGKKYEEYLQNVMDTSENIAKELRQ